MGPQSKPARDVCDLWPEQRWQENASRRRALRPKNGLGMGTTEGTLPSFSAKLSPPMSRRHYESVCAERVSPGPRAGTEREAAAVLGGPLAHEPRGLEPVLDPQGLVGGPKVLLDGVDSQGNTRRAIWALESPSATQPQDLQLARAQGRKVRRAPAHEELPQEPPGQHGLAPEGHREGAGYLLGAHPGVDEAARARPHRGSRRRRLGARSADHDGDAGRLGLRALDRFDGFPGAARPRDHQRGAAPDPGPLSPRQTWAFAPSARSMPSPSARARAGRSSRTEPEESRPSCRARSSLSGAIFSTSNRRTPGGGCKAVTTG